MRTLPWPEMESQEAPGRPIREVLDYLAWISREMLQLGFHSGSDRDEWGRRVHRAYVALFVPMVPSFGDPYPPDVPPARNPGIWPDVPSAAIPGMTLRHQLKVMEMLALQLRARRWLHARSEDVAAWDRRLVAAWTALHHGEGLPMPAEARTEASQAALDEAADADRVLRERAKRRGQQLRQQFASARKQKKTARAATGGSRAAKAPKKAGKATTSGGPARGAAKKKAAGGKAAAAKKAPAKKKTAPGKAAAAKKAPAKKKTAARRKTAARKK